MSRDFFVSFDSIDDAKKGGDILRAVTALDGEQIFFVENRGRSLFVMLVFPKEIDDDFQLLTPVGTMANFKSDVAFVAIKNGQHNGIGYFIDTGAEIGIGNSQFPITEIFDKTIAFFESR